MHNTWIVSYTSTAQAAPGSREAEVADLQVAVGVEQQVGRLQVAVQHVGAVDVLQAPQQLRQWNGHIRRHGAAVV